MSHAEFQSADRRCSISWKALLAVIFWGLSFILTKIALTWLAPRSCAMDRA
jgi:hypothetical protein